MVGYVVPSGFFEVGFIAIALCFIALVGAIKTNGKAKWPYYMTLGAVALVVIWAIPHVFGIHINVSAYI